MLSDKAKELSQHLARHKINTNSRRSIGNNLGIFCLLLFVL